MSDKCKKALDHILSGLLGDEQKKAAARIRDDWCKDEESAGLFNRLLDELEDAAKERK